jgi:hypothetical protein
VKTHEGKNIFWGWCFVPWKTSLGRFKCL